MIHAFDTYARSCGDQVFFRFFEASAPGEHAVPLDDIAASADRMPMAITYAEARLNAARVLVGLREAGVRDGDPVACDMGNCPSFVYLYLACAYGGFMLVTLNHRLTQEEKESRLLDISLNTHRSVTKAYGEDDILDLINNRLNVPQHAMLHACERAAGLFSPGQQSVVMFTSGTSGRPKAACLSGWNLRGSAEAANDALGGGRDVVWQATLPMYHIGGLQIVTRSILGHTPFLLYRRFDAGRVLADGHRYRVTHISVVDKTLRELLKESQRIQDDPTSFRPDGVEGVPSITQYRCLLLGGAVPNPKTLQTAAKARARVASSYGMTETSSLVAFSIIAERDPDQLALLPGYEACIISPDENGYGQLGLKGPGVFDGYLGVRKTTTADGFFLTGDKACIQGRHIVIAERVQDMFVSGGENIYPQEIASHILSVPGVTDCYVFGVKDEEWGRRPVAVVEMADTPVDEVTAAPLAHKIRTSLQSRLARIYQPDQIYVLQQLDRTGIGKVDRAALQARVANAINVRQVDLYRIALPMKKPIVTAKTVLDRRESLVVKVTDANGRTGLGECVAFATDWYLPETLDNAQTYLQRYLIPHVLQDCFFQPDEVYASFFDCPDFEHHALACGALEPALWDLYGKIVQAPLRQLIGANENYDAKGMRYKLPTGLVPGGAVLGIMPVQDTLVAVEQAVRLGYRRVKLKVRPSDGVEVATAVRKAFPSLMLLLDANQSFTEGDMDELLALDALGCACIEEPLNPVYVPRVGPRELFARLGRLQQRMVTPIALDESWVTMADAVQALNNPDLRCLVLKIAKCGGVLPALELYWYARSHGASAWLGGMYDTGISKRLHGAFSLLPGMGIPGDISDTDRYFSTDITVPPFALRKGLLNVNPEGHEFGLGCELDETALVSVTLGHWVYK